MKADFVGCRKRVETQSRGEEGRGWSLRALRNLGGDGAEPSGRAEGQQTVQLWWGGAYRWKWGRSRSKVATELVPDDKAEVNRQWGDGGQCGEVRRDDSRRCRCCLFWSLQIEPAAAETCCSRCSPQQPPSGSTLRSWEGSESEWLLLVQMPSLASRLRGEVGTEWGAAPRIRGGMSPKSGWLSGPF